MKIIETKDLEGKIFWSQYQYLVNNEFRREATMDKVYSFLGPENISKEVRVWPTINYYEHGAIAVLREWGYSVLHSNVKMGFDYINLYVVKRNDPMIEIVTAPLIYFGRLTNNQKKQLNIDVTSSAYDYCFLDSGLEVSGEVVAEFEIKEVAAKIIQARIEAPLRKKYRFSQVFLQNSLDHGLTAIMDVGDRLEFNSSDISDNFIKLAKLRVDVTSYRYVLLNKAAANGREGNEILINIPDEYKGIVIGHEGENIKKAEEQLGKRIFISLKKKETKKLILRKKP